VNKKSHLLEQVNRSIDHYIYCCILLETSNYFQRWF